MKKLLLNIAAAFLTVCGLSAVASIAPAYADGPVYCPSSNSFVSDMTQCEDYAGQIQNTNLMSTVNTVINVIVGMVGFIAVIMIILGGISFITSQGDAAKVTKAKNTILYGVIGLIIALLAFAIVNFVLSSVFKTTA